MWSYFEIKTDEVISQEDIKAMKKNLADIIEIKPVITYQQEEKTVDLKTKSMAELFRDFYTFNKGVEPKGDVEALDICEQNRGRSMWSYFEIKTDEVISQEDIKAMKKNLADIIEIKPVITYQQEEKTVDLKTKSMAELFRDFYTFNKGVEPKGDVMDMFMKIAGEEGGEE